MIKNKKKFLKMVILPSTSVGLLAATVVPLSLITINVGSNPLVLGLASKETLKNRILTESYKGGQELFYKYDGLMFASMNELNKYILEKGDVQSQIISSNPLKIIKDYEYGILDETKIFDTNLNNFVQVFENAFGDVTFSEEEALKTYINGSHLLEQFSYDGVNWYNSDKEAVNAEKQKMKISQSLFYVYNNRYYNAFNVKDINALIANMNNGYYTYLDKNLDGNPASSAEEIIGDKELFGKLLKQHLIPDFTSGYYRQLSVADITNGLEITPKNKRHLKLNGEVVNSDSSLTLVFPDKYYSLDEMVKHFKEDGWTKSLVGHDFQYSKNFDVILNNTIFKDVKLTLWTDHKVEVHYDEEGHSEIIYLPQETNLDDDFIYTTNNSGTIRFYKDKDKHEEFDDLVIKNVKNLFDTALTNDQMMELYKIWFDNYFNDVITNFGLDNNQEVKWQDIKNNIFIKNEGESFLAGEVYKDKIYEINPGKGYNQSLVKSQMDWQIAKQKIINEAEKEGLPLPKPGDKAYAIRPDFKVTKGDLNNFLNLEGNIDARVMYSVSPEEHPSDREGKFLASTEVQAKALKQLFNDDSMKIRYLIFDIYGNEVISNGSDYQSAIKELRSEIKLNSKFVHKKEVENWPGGKRKWADIISDGNYLVYSIPNPNNSQKRIWFLSQDGALKNLKVNLKPQTLEEDIYVYNFLSENNILLPIKFKMNEIDNLVNQIYQAES